MLDLRCGRWQDVLADVTCDVLLTDPPFSGRVHEGQRTGSSTRKSTLVYDAITREECFKIAESWAPRTRHFALIFSDHAAQHWHEAAWESVGWYVFAPVIILREFPTPRQCGDGPTSAAEYLTVARRKPLCLPRDRRGSRRGWYSAPHMNGTAYASERWRPGGKSPSLMRDLIRDYTLPGDLIADPYSGGATTLLAAAIEGRRAVGAEVDPSAWAESMQRLSQPMPQLLPMAIEPRGVQSDLFK